MLAHEKQGRKAATPLLVTFAISIMFDAMFCLASGWRIGGAATLILIAVFYRAAMHKRRPLSLKLRVYVDICLIVELAWDSLHCYSTEGLDGSF